MLEFAEYSGNYYGTPRAFVEKQLAAGINVILEIEVQGAMQIKEKDYEAEFVFITPPSFEVLTQRLLGRGTEDEAAIARRLAIAKDEYAYMRAYEYIVINNTVDEAANALSSILSAAQHKKKYILDELEGVF